MLAVTFFEVIGLLARARGLQGGVMWPEGNRPSTLPGATPGAQRTRGTGGLVEPELLPPIRSGAALGRGLPARTGDHTLLQIHLKLRQRDALRSLRLW